MTTRCIFTVFLQHHSLNHTSHIFVTKLTRQLLLMLQGGGVYFGLQVAISCCIGVSVLLVLHVFTKYCETVVFGELQLCRHWLHCCAPCWCPRVSIFIIFADLLFQKFRLDYFKYFITILILYYVTIIIMIVYYYEFYFYLFIFYLFTTFDITMLLCAYMCYLQYYYKIIFPSAYLLLILNTL